MVCDVNGGKALDLFEIVSNDNNQHSSLRPCITETLRAEMQTLPR